METFLHNVALRIFTEHSSRMDRVTVVFNNQRAGLFLQQQFTNLSSSPLFLPHITGIDDLVAQLGGFRIVPREFLLFELFDIHRNMENIEQRFATFEEFMPFGEMLLSDFSEIDLYRADAAQLFSNLHDLKQLGEWDITGKPLTPFQQKYLNFFRSLHTYYERLRQRLAQKNEAYSGMAYRLVADNISTLVNKLDSDHYYFVGFNAISPCEEAIINCLVRQGKATLLCDGDDYYFSDNRQEAGHFLRQNALHFPSLAPFEKHFSSSKKTIHIVNCPENAMQAKAMGYIVGAMIKENEEANQDSAIVLADEQQLLPVLNSLPRQVNSTNITMGYPFILTNIHSLNNKILNLYLNNRNGLFYHKDVLALLADNFVCRHLNKMNMHDILSQRMNEAKTIFASFDDITRLLDGIKGADSLLYLFKNENPSATEIVEILKETTGILLNSPNITLDTAEKETFSCSLQTLNYLDDLQQQYNFMNSLTTFQRIYQRIAQRRSVAFYGEPLRGLQILGVLETRCLDFSHIVMLSVNEGTIPAGRNESSIIPLALKKRFGLPTYEEKDAVYAYNFYRLLQRCDEAWLLYSTDSEGMGKGEASRFIMQLKDELAPQLPNITVKEHIVQASVSNNRTIDNDVSIAKDANTLHRLDELATKGLSPSALNSYRKCPRLFFMQYILGVREQDEINEELESNELGSFIHSILHDIYNRDSDNRIRVATLRDSLNNLDQLITKCYHDDILKGRDPEGKNYIYGEAAKMQIRHFLNKEIELLEQGHSIQIEMTEESLSLPVSVSVGTQTKIVSIYGITDRVDRLDGEFRICDYKSGSVDKNELSVADKSPSFKDVPDKWFQVMTYSFLFCRKHQYNGPFITGIFPLRSLDSDFMPAFWYNVCKLDNSHISSFEHLLQDLLSELFNPDIPFTATPSKGKCKYCPYIFSCPQKLS